MRRLNKKMCLLALCVSNLALTAQADNLNGTTYSINFMTYNIASLPSPLGYQINGSFLKPNVERVQQIVNVINRLNQGTNPQILTPNVIAFEEAFDSNVRDLIRNQLATYYRYNSGAVGEKTLSAGSGLLLLSQYPILEIVFHPYTNIMVGDELLAHKGYMMAKLKYDNASFITVMFTHLEGGDAIFKDVQSAESTTSFRRGEQMGRMYSTLQIDATTPPKGYENLKYLKTVVMGDFNDPLNNENEEKSISTGMTDSNYKQGQIEYPGQNLLFSILKSSVPVNFADVHAKPVKRGDDDHLDPVLLQAAIQANKFTGSTISTNTLKDNLSSGAYISRQNTEYNVIDGLYVSLDGVAGDLQTQLVSLNELSAYKYEMSDHLTLMGRFTFTR